MDDESIKDANQEVPDQPCEIQYNITKIKNDMQLFSNNEKEEYEELFSHKDS